MLKELNDLKETEKLNPTNTAEVTKQFPERFDWRDALLTETERKCAVEDLLIECHDIFARHRMDIWMNTDLKMKLTPKDDKAVYNQTRPMLIHFKANLNVELALMHKN